MLSGKLCLQRGCLQRGQTVYCTVSIVVVVMVSFAIFAFKMISLSLQLELSTNVVSHDRNGDFFFLRFIVPQDRDFSEKLLRLI